MVTRSRATSPRRESARQHERSVHLPVRAFFVSAQPFRAAFSGGEMRMRSRAFLPRRERAR